MQLLLTFSLLIASLTIAGQTFTVAAVKNNVLWAGLDNPISITVENKSSKNIIAKTDNGRLTKVDDHYIFYTDTGDVANITIFEKRAGKEIRIGVTTFKVRQKPDPIPRVGGNRSGRVSVAAFKSQAGVSTDEHFYPDRGIQVVSFSFSLVRGTDFLYEELKNLGNAFNTETKNAIAQAQPGDSIVINRILAKRHDGTITILEPLTFTLY